jgi:hypothetical protein
MSLVPRLTGLVAQVRCTEYLVTSPLLRTRHRLVYVCKIRLQLGLRRSYSFLDLVF